MKAVLFAAGKSTRTHPLTVERPKPLLSVAGESILLHNLRALDGIVSEAYVVVGFEAKQVEEHVRSHFNSKKLAVRFVHQKEALGTCHALLQAHEHLDDRFLVLNGDDYYSPLDLKRLAKHELGVLGAPVTDFRRFGLVVTKGELVTSIVEKPRQRVSDIANTGAYALDMRIFPFLTAVGKSSTGEYYLTDAIRSLAAKADVHLETIHDYWIPIGYPWDVLSANEYFLSQLDKPVIAKDAIVEEGVRLIGPVHVGPKTKIRSGAYIEGPVHIGAECAIGPNCYIRPFTSIGDRCRVGNAVEIKNSVLGEHTFVGHLSYLGDSVLGSHVNLGAGTIVANLRHDKAVISSLVKGVLVPTGRIKMGTIIGDYAHTGIHTSIYPGRKIWPHMSTLPGEIVKKDVM